MSNLLAMAVPITKGKEAEFKKFLEELDVRWSSEFNESRNRLNVRERTFHQKTPDGELVIVTLEGENPEQAFSDFAKGNDDFTRWFVQKVKEIHNVDLETSDQIPLPELVIDTKQKKSANV